VRFDDKKTLLEAWEYQIPEMAGLGTVFPCVPTHFNPLTDVVIDVAGREDAGFQDAVVVAMVDDEQSAGSDELPEVADGQSVLGQTTVKVGQSRQ